MKEYRLYAGAYTDGRPGNGVFFLRFGADGRARIAGRRAGAAAGRLRQVGRPTKKTQKLCGSAAAD